MNEDQSKIVTDFLWQEIPKVTKGLFAKLNIGVRDNIITYRVLNCHILAEYIKILVEKI